MCRLTVATNYVRSTITIIFRILSKRLPWDAKMIFQFFVKAPDTQKQQINFKIL